MKFTQLITFVMLAASSQAVLLQSSPKSVSDVQLKLSTRAQSLVESNNQLFAELHSKVSALQQIKNKSSDEGAKEASIGADAIEGVVDKVSERWLGSIDKEEPEIADEFLRKMKDAISEIHATEGYPMGKVRDARDGGDDWLTKIVKANEKMRSMIPKATKEDRVAIADS